MKYILYYKQQISRWNVTNCTYILPWISPRHLRCFCWFSSSSPWLLSVLAWPAQWRSPRPGACTPTWRTRSSCRWWVSCSGRSPSLWCSGRSGRTGRRMSATGGSSDSMKWEEITKQGQMSIRRVWLLYYHTLYLESSRLEPESLPHLKICFALWLLPWCWREGGGSGGSPCCPSPAPPSSTRPWRPAWSSGVCTGAWSRPTRGCISTPFYNDNWYNSYNI